MLAVKPAYRNHKLGFKLKLAQRERVLTQGVKRITWTFDPLQSLNAHLNFGKLGVISHTYKINFYGETTSSFLHQIGTDRLWVTWLIESQRTRERLKSDTDKNKPPLESENAAALVQVSSGWEPRKNTGSELFARNHLSLEIPWDINDLQRERPKLAVEWRKATRWAFTEAFKSNYLVEDFYRTTRNDQPVGVYLLTSQRTNLTRF
jgi:predicted GNAT superfamily acetyltransferase